MCISGCLCAAWLSWLNTEELSGRSESSSSLFYVRLGKEFEKVTLVFLQTQNEPSIAVSFLFFSSVRCRKGDIVEIVMFTDIHVNNADHRIYDYYCYYYDYYYDYYFYYCCVLGKNKKLNRRIVLKWCFLLCLYSRFFFYFLSSF